MRRELPIQFLSLSRGFGTRMKEWMNEQLPQWKLLLQFFSCIDHSPLLILQMAQDLDRLFQDEVTMPKCCPHHTICPATKHPLRCPSHVPHEVTHSGGVAPLRHSERTFYSGCAIWPHETALKFQLRGYLFIHIPFNNLFLALYFEILVWSSVQFSSVAQSCPTLCNPMNRSTPGLPVHHQLPEFTQIHVHRIGDAIQPSHPLSSPSPPAPNPSQHQGLFQWVNSSHEVAKVLELQHQSFQWTPRTGLL